jgi:hypothetical protein
MSTPPPVTQGEFIESLWRAVKAGAITWDDVRALQAQHMPRCLAHDAPANVKIGGVPMCVQCIEERRREA